MRFIVVVMTFLAATVAHASDLNIKLEGFRNGDGFVAVSIFSESHKEAFPGDASRAEKTFYLPLNGKKEIVIEATGLNPDTYAIAVMHDEDGDRKLKTALGVPREGFGFSNNPRVLMGAPSFKKTSFELGSGTKDISISLKYFL